MDVVVMSKRAQRAARRAELSGAGPVRQERPVARFPGAAAKFALFGEVLMVGLLITLVGLLVVTLPAGLAAGIRHMRRFLHAEGSPQAAFWRDVRAALPGGVVVGGAGALLAAVLTLDIVLAGSGALPGGPLVAVVGWLGVIAVGVVLLRAASLWAPETGWRAAVRAVPATLAADPIGVGYLVASVVFVGVVTWMLPPLIIAGLGCAALAAIAIAHRARRG